MKSQRSINTITAAVFALALILSSSAQAGTLLGFDRDSASRTAIEHPIGLFDQVSSWLNNAWTDLTSMFAQDTTTPPPTTSGTCDAGWGLDPEGCPR
jgi:hypothetical protein